MRTLLLKSLLALSLFAPATLAAQSQPKVFLGGSALMGSPQNDFATNVGRTWGGSANMVASFDRHRLFGIRLDGGVMGYGHESFEVPLSTTVGGRVRVNVSTDNIIGYFGAGPQLMAPNGKLRPYVAGTVGFAYFATTSSVRGDNSDAFASDTNYDDANLQYRGIGGLYIPLRAGRVPVSLDLSAQYHGNGTASYLRKGDIHDNSDGTISFTPRTTEANLVSFHVGVSVGIPQRLHPVRD